MKTDTGCRVVVGQGRHAAIPSLLGEPAQDDFSAPTWPFRRHVTPEAPSPSGGVWIHALHEAFPAHQVPGTRLVLTQSTYQLQRWLDWLERHPGVRVVADADRDGLRRSSPEAFAGRGPWARIAILDTEDVDPAAAGHEAGERDLHGRSQLHAAFSQPDPERRLAACRTAVDATSDDPALHLACASVYMELQRLDEAHAHLEQAFTLSPDWEAVHFETGKLWLRADDTGRAAAAFAEAGRLMPGFAAAFSNLGAALGELDRGDEALAALQQALAYDPAGYPVINNLGAVYRELGRLAEAEGAFRRVIDLAPAFVFGFYNLAHTLFLAGRFAESRDAYAEGMRRDPQKNARQACRLAVARTAAGDPSGAIADLEALANRVTPEALGDLMQEAESTLTALSGLSRVDEAGIARVLDRVRRYSS